MADSNVASLQNQLNRFAQVAGFAALGVDGIMGSNTGNAVLKGLAYVANNDSDEHDTAAGLAVALVNNDGSINYAQMSTSAYGLATYFGQIADSLNLAQPSSKVYTVAHGGSSSHSTQQVLTTPNEGGAGALATNLLLAVKNLPTWAKVAGGMSLALVTVAAVQHAKEHHGSLKGFMGFEGDGAKKKYLVLDRNGDPYSGGYTATEMDSPKERYGVYRGDIGARSRTWWRQYARRNGYRLSMG